MNFWQKDLSKSWNKVEDPKAMHLVSILLMILKSGQKEMLRYQREDRTEREVTVHSLVYYIRADILSPYKRTVLADILSVENGILTTMNICCRHFDCEVTDILSA